MSVRETDGRMIGVFGKREMELAALRILDQQWDRPTAPVNIGWFRNEDERHGFELLQEYGWIDARNIPTRAFWERVHGR